jgi:hypothetical protein
MVIWRIHVEELNPLLARMRGLDLECNATRMVASAEAQLGPATLALAVGGIPWTTGGTRAARDRSAWRRVLADVILEFNRLHE